MNVCVCTKVDKKKIENLAAAGIDDWIDASAVCGAGRYCGGCIKRFRQLFEEAKRNQRARQIRKAA